MSVLNPSSWFRSSARKSLYSQTGSETVNQDTVVETGDLDDSDFTTINVRPMTYAEASVQQYPAANRRVVSEEPYNPIDEDKLTVQVVDNLLRHLDQTSKSGPSINVVQNLDYESNISSGAKVIEATPASTSDWRKNRNASRDDRRTNKERAAKERREKKREASIRRKREQRALLS